MAEEQTNIENTNTEVTTPQYTDVELQAIEQGWKPKDEFHDENKKFIDAEEFIERKRFYDTIDSQKRKIKDLERSMQMLQDHHRKVAEVSYKQAYEDLKKEKLEALDKGDAQKLVEIDEKMLDLKTQQTAAIKPVDNTPHPNFVKWVNSNPWYVNDLSLRGEADRIGLAYAAANPDKDPDEVVNFVSSQIKILHPDKFRNPNKTKPASVEGASTTKSTKVTTSMDLTEEEERVMKTFVRQGIMTREEYIDELKKVKGI